MTTEEMIQRIQEIEDSYQHIIAKQQADKKYLERIAYENKCFKIANPSASCKNVIAIKILKIMPQPDQNYARCIVISKLNIANKAIALWDADVPMRMCFDTPSAFSKFVEINENEFNEIFQNQISEISTYDEKSIIT